MDDGGYWKVVELGGRGGEPVVAGTVNSGGRAQGGKLVAGGGYWKAVELTEAAAVVNPVAKKLVAALERRKI